MALILYRLAVLAMIMVNSMASLGAIWNFADLSMRLMAIINLVSILLLLTVAFALFRDYEAQLKAGKEPVFDPSRFPKLVNSTRLPLVASTPFSRRRLSSSRTRAWPPSNIA
jgi:AGCS family alanine or glycine:cation symporter